MEHITPDTKGAISRDLLRTFFMSFEHSQGEVATQKSILMFAGPTYRDRITECAEIPSLEAFLGDLGNIAVRMTVPAWHRPLLERRSDNPAEEFNEMWQHVRAIILPSRDMSERGVSAKLIGRIGKGIMERDIRFITEFQSRESGSDPHKSYFREHGILRRPTPCPVINDMYGHLHARVPELLQTPSGQELAKRWEKFHPGQQFYPAPEGAA